jgi:hypothetical protein
VHYHGARRRPPGEAALFLAYHRADARGSLTVTQRAATAEKRVAWAGLEAPRFETVERDGVEYTLARGDRRQGGQDGVSFERDGTAIQLQSQELRAEQLLELAATLVPV